MDSIDRERAQKALTHIRAALIANKAGAPVGPALEAAEEHILRMLFSEKDVTEYLQSSAALRNIKKL